jgi:hypothetical protein
MLTARRSGRRHGETRQSVELQRIGHRLRSLTQTLEPRVSQTGGFWGFAESKPWSANGGDSGLRIEDNRKGP